ncbi:hypothetical protein V8G54_009574 [Vigna mungo]|uniref:Integrase catalytic domain-containing protein n=1 Tax=Vigna mungo TaxID=3915 RepID=A0AAQ3S407_VIGMU
MISVTPNDDISLQKSKSSALNEEMRRKTQGTSSHSELLKESKDKKGKQRERDHDDYDHVITTTCGDLKEFFTSYILGDFGVLKMGNDEVSNVIGVGDVYLQINMGMQLLLKGVKHAPDVRFNLISVQVLDDGEYDNHFGSRKWKLTKGKLISTKLEKCSYCMTSKQTKVSFKKRTSSRKSEFLELVKSFSGALYFVTFIDDCSRKIWVYSLQKNDQMSEKFKEFHALVERQSSKKLKRIRTDNDGEYCGPFDPYCRVMCMISEAKLPKHFEGEALHTIVHVINLSPAVALNSKRSDKIWFGKNVTYDHLHVFDFKEFVHVPKDERSKLDVKTRQLYDPINKVVRTRDAKFMEDKTIKDIDKVEKPTPKEDGNVVDVDPIWFSTNDLDIDDEMKSLHENQTYDLVKSPKDKRALENKWIIKVKQESNSISPRYKARLMVKQMDVKTTFLHGDLEEEIYMKQPDDFLVEGKQNYVYRL